jgi:NADH dehydrogenase (ubiquinone) 1 alpha subcomplex subunit 5
LYANGQKYDTRIAGVEVIPNAREILLALYAKADKMCDDYGLDIYYNEFVKTQVGFRREIVEQHEEVHIIEDTISCGQIEELVEQARDDIEALYHYNEIYLNSEGKDCELGSSSGEELSADEDPRLGETGLLVTEENYEELLASFPDPTAEELAGAIAERERMAEMMAVRAREAEKGAAEHLARNTEEGGGWRVGS